jgi:signal transduction histidine kinase
MKTTGVVRASRPVRALFLAPLWLAVLLFPCSAFSGSAEPDESKLVIVLYPEANNGAPGNALADRGVRSGFGSGTREEIKIYNEYLDLSRFAEATYQKDLASFLRRKYADRNVDLVMTALASGLDFTIAHREEMFPQAPIVFFCVDRQELSARRLEADVIGIPLNIGMRDSLDLALRLHPQTEQVFVVAGKSKYDAFWDGESRKRFAEIGQKVKLTHLSGLTMPDLLEQVAKLPEHSLIYYLHVFEDGDGYVHVPADALSRVSRAANAPVYSHVASYLGRGIVGGRMYSFEHEGERAARLGLRILAGEAPERIGVQQASENDYVFDWQQLQRWGIRESELPPGSSVGFKEYTLWDRYRWHIAAVVAFVILQTMLIVRLVGQRRRLAKAKNESQESQQELQTLTGKLLGAQETERRMIASELHDDFGQSLALLSVEIDLLRRSMVRSKPGPSHDAAAESKGQSESLIDAMSTQVKQLSTSIHDLSHQLHPLKLERLGLVAALSGLCNELGRTKVLRMDFLYQDVPASVPQAAAVCLYRIAQEALQNVIKHSQARRAVVELRGVNGEIRLRIHDDGKGFELDSPAGQGGLGLVSMRERLRAVRGDIVVTAQPTHGTQIEVRVPLHNNGHDNGRLMAIPSG